jgi:hypothetical protein
MCALAWTLIYNWIKFYKKDIVIMIDKTGRWEIFFLNLFGQPSFELEGKTYFLNPETALLSKGGKSFYVFSKNKPMPLKLTYNEARWIGSDALMGIINNEFVKQIVKPIDTIKDMFLMIGAVGGIIAGISSLIILANQLGLFGTVAGG